MVDPANVAGLEPVVDESVAGLLWLVPIRMEHRRTSYQNFSVFGDADLDVSQRLANTSHSVSIRCVDGDDGGCFGESVAFMNADAYIGIPFGEFASQRRAARDEKLTRPPIPARTLEKTSLLANFHAGE